MMGRKENVSFFKHGYFGYQFIRFLGGEISHDGIGKSNHASSSPPYGQVFCLEVINQLDTHYC